MKPNLSSKNEVCILFKQDILEILKIVPGLLVRHTRKTIVALNGNSIIAFVCEN